MSPFEVVQAIQSACVGVVGLDSRPTVVVLRPLTIRTLAKWQWYVSGAFPSESKNSASATRGKWNATQWLPPRSHVSVLTMNIRGQSTLFFSWVDAFHLPFLHLHGLAGPLLASPSDRVTCRHQMCPFDLKVYRLLAYPFGLSQCLPLRSFDRCACRPMLLPRRRWYIVSSIPGFRASDPRPGTSRAPSWLLRISVKSRGPVRGTYVFRASRWVVDLSDSWTGPGSDNFSSVWDLSQSTCFGSERLPSSFVVTSLGKEIVDSRVLGRNRHQVVQDYHVSYSGIE